MQHSVLNKVNNYTEDLKAAEKIEKKIADYLNKLTATNENLNFLKIPKKCSEYDIICFNTLTLKTQKTFEVKCDFVTKDYGNVSCEMYKYIKRIKQDSGLSISKSDYFIFYFPNFKEEIFFIKTDKLKQLYKNKTFKTYDNHGYNCSLVKFKDFEKEVDYKLNINKKITNVTQICLAPKFTNEIINN